MNIKNKLGRAAGIAAVVAAGAVGLTGVASASTTQPAAATSMSRPADAHSTIGFGGCYGVKGICIPRGTFSINTRSVGGSGNRINYVDAGFTYFGQISNLWIDFDFSDAKGNLVPGGHLQGPEKYGHFPVAAQSWSWGSSWFTAPKDGKVCATLFSQQPGYIKTWVRACNNIG